ncbi:hypothetical protein KCU97_g24196, partial [Aureobasidium melanogenum]
TTSAASTITRPDSALEPSAPEKSHTTLLSLASQLHLAASLSRGSYLYLRRAFSCSEPARASRQWQLAYTSLVIHTKTKTTSRHYSRALPDFFATMDLTFISIHDLTPDARVLYSSDSIVDVLGWTPDEV